MTEFEINKAVAHKIGVEDDYGTFTPLKKYSFDPCNNVEQAWEIMMSYGITIVFQGGKYQFATIDGEIEVKHEKPLVAAMLCFLEL